MRKVKDLNNFGLNFELNKKHFMRNMMFILMLTFSFVVQGQEILFSNTVDAAKVPSQFRLGVDLSRHYLSTRYVEQGDFFAPVNFWVMVDAGTVLIADFTGLQNHPVGSQSYNGRLSGTLRGDISFSRYKDRVAGMILLEDGRKFMIDQTAPRIFAISQTMEESFINKEKGPDYVVTSLDAGSNEVQGESLVSNSICDSANLCAGASIIDLMVVFTSRVDSAWGGINNTIANITQAVNNMTTSMTNTGVNNVSFRLTYAGRINYAESGNMSTDLSRLAGTTDGFMDSVHILRNQYGADMVSLLTGPGGSYCGLGYLNTSSTAYSSGSAFNVTMYSCAVGNYTMSHEFGHNMGLRHDWFVDGGTTPCTHHHGYVNQQAIQLGSSSTSSQRWRTIMAYNDQCSNAGFSCSRLNRWSNPNITYNGAPTGVLIGGAQSADEAFAFYRMACQVAAFRVAPSSCASPAGLTASSVTANSASLSWNSVTGAQFYKLQYRISTSAGWTLLADSLTQTVFQLSGLSGSTLYYWQVRATCTSDTSTYSQSQFTTLSLCGTPAQLSAGSITSTSANLSWAALSGASTYEVEYKTSASATWLPAASGITSSVYLLTGLSPATAYNWRVRADCGIAFGNYAQASFNTIAQQICTDAYESNNIISQAKSVGVNKVINASLATGTDVDWYSFVTGNNSATNVRVILYNLPQDYDIYLYNGSQLLISSGERSGLTQDTVFFNSLLRKARYYIRIVGKNGAFTPYSCYSFRVTLSSLPYSSTNADSEEPYIIEAPSLATKPEWLLYPVPAKDNLNLLYFSEVAGNAEIDIMDVSGRLLQKQIQNFLKGANQSVLNISGLKTGLYAIGIRINGRYSVKKFVIQ
jgi:hypothetical protein